MKITKKKYFLLALVFMGFSLSLIYGQWELVNPYIPVNDGLNDIFFVNDFEGWVVGEQGSVLKTETGGQDWVLQLSSSLCYDLYSVDFYNSNIGWAVGEYNTIQSTADGGTTWVAQNAPVNGILFSVEVIDSLVCWAAGNSGTVLKTTNSGQTWNLVVSPVTGNIEWRDIHFVKPELGFMVGFYPGSNVGVLAYTLDQGNSWTQASHNFENLFAVQFINENLGYTVGDDGKIYHSSNGGITWVDQEYSVPLNAYRDLTDVFFTNQDTGIAVGKGRRLLRTINGGVNWEVADHLDNLSWYSAVHGSPEIGFWTISDFHSGLFQSQDNGESWDLTNGLTTYNLTKIHFLNENFGWIEGTGHPTAAILVTDNGGLSWSSVDMNYSGDLKRIWFVDESTVWGLDNGPIGKMLKSIDGGFNWTIIDSVFSNNALDLVFTSTNTGWIANPGLLLKTTDGGNSWQDKNPGIPFGGFKKLHFLNDQKGWVGDFTFDQLLFTSDGGENWEIQDFGNGSSLIDFHFVTASIGFAALSDGVYKSENGGESWFLLIQGVLGNRIYFIDETIGWIVGGYGTIFKTTDGGVTWNQEGSNLCYQGLNDIFFSAPNNGFIIGNGGTILEYSNTSTSHLAQQPESETFFSISPNPTTGILYIHSSSIPEGTINIFSIEGRLIKSYKYNGNTLIVNIEEKVKGIYIIQFENERVQFSEKIVLIR